MSAFQDVCAFPDYLRETAKCLSEIWSFALREYDHVRGPNTSSFYWRYGNNTECFSAEYTVCATGGMKPQGAPAGHAETPLKAGMFSLGHLLDFLSHKAIKMGEGKATIVWRAFEINSWVNDAGQTVWSVYARLAVLPANSFVMEATE